MELFVLTDIDWGDFNVVGVYPSLERAKGTAKDRGLTHGVYQIEELTMGDVNQQLPYWESKDGNTWVEKTR